jgi:hypothetical protein
MLGELAEGRLNSQPHIGRRFDDSQVATDQRLRRSLLIEARPAFAASCQMLRDELPLVSRKLIVGISG